MSGVLLHKNHFIISTFLFLFLKYFIYLFLERGVGKEKEGSINVWLPLTCPLLGTWSTTQAHALTGNRTNKFIFKDGLDIRDTVMKTEYRTGRRPTWLEFFVRHTSALPHPGIHPHSPTRAIQLLPGRHHHPTFSQTLFSVPRYHGYLAFSQLCRGRTQTPAQAGLLLVAKRFGWPSCLPSHCPHILTSCPFPQAPPHQLQKQAWLHTPKEGRLCLVSIPKGPGTAVLCQEFAPGSQQPRGGLGQVPSPA